MAIPGPSLGHHSDTTPPDRNDNVTRRLVGITPVSLFIVLFLFWIFTQIQIVWVLALLALLFGTILEGPVSFLERRRYVPRPAAIAMVYAIILGAIVLLVVAIVPVVADQASTFREEVPHQLHDLKTDWEASSNPLLNSTGADLLQRGIDLFEGDSEGVSVSSDAAQAALPIVLSITSTLVSGVSLLVITFYYLMEKALIRRMVIAQLPEKSQGRVDRVWGDVERKVGGWIRGQMILCLVIGAIATISYGIIGLPFWPLLGLWAGLTEAMPIVGPWIGGVPAVILALTVGWDKAILVALVIIGMQTLENWFLVPRVMRGAVGLTPLTVFIAILAGQQFLGIVGALLAIPVAAAIQVIIGDWLDSRRARGDEVPVTSGWRWMLSRSMLTGTEPSTGDTPSTLIPHDPTRPDHQEQIESATQTISFAPSEPTPPAANTPDTSAPEASSATGEQTATNAETPSSPASELPSSPWSWHRTPNSKGNPRS